MDKSVIQSAAVSKEVGSVRLAAIDVGSNSVHMIVAQADPDGAVTTLWRVKEMVGLGRISFPSKALSREAMDRCVASLARMQQAARQREAEKIIAVATSAIREARNGGDLIERIKRDLKLYVKVVSAREEARLIYLGIRSAMRLGRRPHLMIDIGGGSVEFIVGNDDDAKLLESRKLGAARMTAQFVKSDPISKTDIGKLRQHYEQELEPLLKKIKALRPVSCIGTSGTLENIAGLCRAEGGEAGVIDSSSVERLCKRLVRTNAEERAQLRGLDDHRKEQIVAGVVLVSTVMQMLGIQRIDLCNAALREGILGDYLSRHLPDLAIRKNIPDPRRRSVLDLARRCNWHQAHSTQVARLTLKLFDDLAGLHKLAARDREIIEYGAMLHDIGWHIAPKRHHRHSEYLILNGDLRGFNEVEISIIANIARYHRKKPPAKADKGYAQLPLTARAVVNVGAALLRIADGLDRSHASAVQNVKCRVDKKVIQLGISSNVDIQLELWAARKKLAWFEHVFKHKLEFEVSH
ncbi:MAG: Ppx/GppA family phosphatase [Burkholderiales bacterium]|nr:Ppx/GppA family phosphatase [Phycisphaerae bacterium]